jgi:hypothetical protein
MTGTNCRRVSIGNDDAAPSYNFNCFVSTVTKKEKGRAGNRAPTSGILRRLRFSNYFSIKKNFYVLYLNHGTVNISLLGRPAHSTITASEHVFLEKCLEHL